MPLTMMAAKVLLTVFLTVTLTVALASSMVSLRHISEDRHFG